MLVRVLEIPPPTGNFHFSCGEPQAFVEVDWFRSEQTLEPDQSDMMETEKGRVLITEMVKSKLYFDPTKAYLILHPSYSFTINYSAP